MIPFLPPGVLPPPPPPGPGVASCLGGLLPPGVLPPPGAPPPGAYVPGLPVGPGGLVVGALGIASAAAHAKGNPQAQAQVESQARAWAQAQEQARRRQQQAGARGRPVVLGPSGSEAQSESAEGTPCPMPTLPCLLVPGFLSSRLVAASTSVHPAWQGQLIWLSLSKLGFQAMHAKGLYQDEQQMELKNKWLQHLMLKNGDEEADGVHLEAVQGIEGVRCLDPESLFGMAAEGSQIFGVVIKLLESFGYEPGRDFDAVSYDWRFSPEGMERRENYFERMITRIEQLNTRGTGVVLVGHSMGNKTVRYFLEYAKGKVGQGWLNKHVHSWVSAGGPLLGSPQAVRSTVQGMLEVQPLFSIGEAIVFARCLSSSPWLFPIGTSYKEPYHFLRRQGLLEVRCRAANVSGCGLESTRNKVMLEVVINWGGKRGEERLSTKSADPFDGHTAWFPEELNTLLFGKGPAELPADATITVVVKEKGIHDDEDRNNYFKRIGKNLVAGAKVLGEALRGHKTLGVPRASTEAVPIAKLLESSSLGEDGLFEAELPLKVQDKSNFVTLKVKWMDYSTLRSEWLGGQELRKPGQTDEVPVKYSGKAEVTYDAMDIKPLLTMECPEVLSMWERYYEADPLTITEGVDDCPPIQRVVAVHGVNVKTEIMYALRLNSLRVKPGEVHTRFVLDDEAQLVQKRPGLTMSGGMIYEEAGGSEPSGDGVVPLASMEHCRTWAKRIDVQVERIEGAMHGPMLGNEQFHEVLRRSLAENLTPARLGQQLLSASFCLGEGSQRQRKWQAAKDNSLQAWWDFPPDVGAQLSMAYRAGQPSVSVSFSGNSYNIDLHRMVQRNTQTGVERTIRLVEA